MRLLLISMLLKLVAVSMASISVIGRPCSARRQRPCSHPWNHQLHRGVPAHGPSVSWGRETASTPRSDVPEPILAIMMPVGVCALY